ncbi:hypothetical protein [Larkinella humicola]|nr:hypothetical protein [Larkinella humicola]
MHFAEELSGSYHQDRPTLTGLAISDFEPSLRFADPNQEVHGKAIYILIQ